MSDPTAATAAFETVIAAHESDIDAAMAAETRAALGGIQQQVEQKRPGIANELRRRALMEIVSDPVTTDITKVCQVYAVHEKGLTPEAAELANEYEARVAGLNTLLQEADTVIRYGQVLGKPDPNDTDITIKNIGRLLETERADRRTLRISHRNVVDETHFDIPQLYIELTPKAVFELQITTDASTAEQYTEGEGIIVGQEAALAYARAVLEGDLATIHEPEVTYVDAFTRLLESAHSNGATAFYEKLRALPGADSVIAYKRNKLIEGAKGMLDQTQAMYLVRDLGIRPTPEDLQDIIKAIDNTVRHYADHMHIELFNLAPDVLRNQLLKQYKDAFDAKKQAVFAAFQEQEKQLDIAISLPTPDSTS